MLVIHALISECCITPMCCVAFVAVSLKSPSYTKGHVSPRPIGSSVLCINCMRGDPVHFCHTAEVWTRPLTSGTLSTALPLEWTTTVCPKLTTHLTGTHTLFCLHLCTVGACRGVILWTHTSHEKPFALNSPESDCCVSVFIFLASLQLSSNIIFA